MAEKLAFRFCEGRSNRSGQDFAYYFSYLQVSLNGRVHNNLNKIWSLTYFIILHERGSSGLFYYIYFYHFIFEDTSATLASPEIFRESQSVDSNAAHAGVEVAAPPHAKETF